MRTGKARVNFSVAKCLNEVKKDVKQEISEYYSTIFSRRAGAPICITLCIFTIVSFAISHF
jgi:hypothetical protein